MNYWKMCMLRRNKFPQKARHLKMPTSIGMGTTGEGSYIPACTFIIDATWK